MLQHRRLVPSLHFTEPNPDLGLPDSPFYVNTELVEWTASGGPLRAGVNSFGIGGANAHAVLEEPTAREHTVRASEPALGENQLLVLSARSATALDKITDNLARHLRKSTLDLADVAYTLAMGRRGHEYRRALVCDDIRDAAMTLMLRDPDRLLDGHTNGASVDVVFVFADRLSHGRTDAVTLYQELPAFRGAVERCLTTAGIPTVDPVSLLGGVDPTAVVIAHCALANLWNSWNVRPSALVGFGAGELAAACIAGMLGIDTALQLARTGGSVSSAVATTTPTLPLWLGTANKWVTIGELHEPEQVTEWSGLGTSPTEQGEWVDREAVLAKLFDGARQVLLDLDLAGSCRAGLLRAVGQAWTQGVAVDWAAVHAGEQRHRVPLPTYPFERKRYWVTPPPQADASISAPSSVAESLRIRFNTANSQRKAELVLEFLRSEVADMLGASGPQFIDPRQDLFSFGLDSLDLINIVAKLSAELDTDMPVSLFGEHPSIRTYVDNLAESSGWAQGSSGS